MRVKKETGVLVRRREKNESSPRLLYLSAMTVSDQKKNTSSSGTDETETDKQKT